MGVSFQHLSLFPAVRLNYGISEISTTIAAKDTGAEKSSPGLEGLKSLILEALEERAPHEKTLHHAEHRARRAGRLSRISQFYGVRIFMRPWILPFAHAAHDAELAARKARTDAAACFIDVDFGLDEKILNQFDEVLRAFEPFKYCPKIFDMMSPGWWDWLRRKTEPKREAVTFELTDLPVIKSAKRALKFADGKQGDLIVYPGFAMVRHDEHDFALIDIREIDLVLARAHVAERDEAPLVEYAELRLTSDSGLNKTYMAADYGKAAAFDAAWHRYHFAARQAPAHPPAKRAEPQAAPAAAPEATVFVPPAEPEVGFYDGLVLLAALLLVLRIAFGNPFASPPPPASDAHNLPAPQVQQSSAAVLPPLAPPSSAAQRQAARPAAQIQTMTAAPAKPATAVSTIAARPPQRGAVPHMRATSNLRSQPSTSAKSLARISAGEPVTILERRNGWLRVRDSRKETGWIRADLVTDTRS
jgi:SH3 domain-containing protein